MTEERFVGYRKLTVEDKVQGVTFPVMTFYPTQAPSKSVAFGPYRLDVAMDSPIAGTHLPVVVISHGGGGTPLVLRTFAFHLAQNGYVVALLEHPGNNRNDNSLEDTVQNLENRPRHIRLTIDAVAADPELGAHIDSNNVAVIGHSMGGYTALAVTGAVPVAGMGKTVDVVPDSRVKALVLMAPATGWFVLNDSLRNVKVPILLLAAELDKIAPRWNAQLVLDLIPDPEQVTFKLVKNAGHFSFLSPYPPELKRADLLPSTDPEGFDREAFHQELNADLLAFLDRTLKKS